MNYLQKIALLCFLLWGYGVDAQVPSTDKNAIIHQKARIATSNPSALDNNHQNAATTIQYMDGLGRPIQSVGYRATPTAKDLVQQSTQYDNYGRQVRVYLAAPSTAAAGAYQSNPLSLGQGFYNGDTHPYQQIKQFENSPLDRIKQSYGAGQAWQTNNKYKETFYESAGTDVRLYRVDASGNVNLVGTYPSNSLFKTRIIDEQGHTTIEVKDKQGRLVESQQQDDTGFMITHYIYDGLDRPIAIIQPQGYALNSSFSYNSGNYQNYIFAYEYGDANRISRKHIPNGGWTSYVYDKADRPVLEQNALQAQNNKWNFIKYDVLGRVIITGELTSAYSRTSLQTSFDAITTPYETWNGSAYTYQSYPIGYPSTNEKTRNYYDQYAWIASEWAFNSSTAYNASSYYSNATGLATGGWTRSTENQTVLYHTVLHYDNKGRVLQTYQTHQKGGSNLAQKPIRTDYEYNFAGEVTKEKVTYRVDGQSDTEVLTTNEYDHVGRLLKVFHSINGAAQQEICRYTYDEIGRMTKKMILPNGNFIYGGAKDYITRPTMDGAVTKPNTNDIARKAIVLEPIIGIQALDLTTYTAQIDPNASNGIPITGLQTIDYSYHIRGGGLRGLNLDNSGNAVPKASEGDLFSYKLDYETAGQWDGNIGKQSWKNDTEGERAYTYTYDPAKRLKNAAYTGMNSENYGIPNMAYDKNGNITALQRNGLNSGAYGLIDNLTYTYAGNRLSSVADAVSGDHDVDLVPRGGGAYTYYANGNLKSDANEQIQNIVYNTYLNQPTEVTLTDGRKYTNFYDGGGTLFKKVYYSSSNSVLETWEYVRGIVFKNGAFYQMASPEGRALYNGTSWEYEFNYQDHLGNARISFKANGTNLEKTSETAFDPWGVVLTGAGQENGFQNRWELQGKEKENTFNLNRIDFGARTFNPTIARWDGVDPLAEKREWLSGYNYVQNNPILRIDPNGAFDTKAEAQKYAEDNNIKTGFFRSNKIQKSDDGSYAINNRKEKSSTSNDKDFGIMTGALITGQRGGPKTESQIWNEATSPNSDANIINIGADFAFLGGGGYQFQAVRINKGKDAGWHYYHTTDANIGYGAGAGISISSVDFNENNDRGQAELRAADFEGNGNNYSASYGVMSFGYGYTTTDGKHTMNPAVSNKLYTTKTFGVGPGLGYYWQGTNSKIIK